MDAHQISRLTSEWIAELPGEDSTVVSGLGVWPLLALLAQLADGPAQTELAAAAGAQYQGLLESTPELRMALGLWTRPEVPLESGVDDLVAPSMRGVLNDQGTLDTWVVEQTGGLLDKMPVVLDEDTLLLLASALAVRLKWQIPCKETVFRPSGPMTVITVKGRGDIDVRLVVAEPERRRNEVLVGALGIDDEGPTGIPLLAGWITEAAYRKVMNDDLVQFVEVRES